MNSSDSSPDFFGALMDFFNQVNGVIWADWVLYAVLAVGVLFTLWSGFCQFRAIFHGTAVTAGKYDDKDDPGAINHFQALSAALSATVGLGNIGGVAVAIALGGPGAVFWMWMVGLAGMALKTTSVTLAMLHRNVDDPENPRGGPMYVAQKGFERWGLKWLGSLIGGLFCVTLFISAITGGNMFQAWNVGVTTNEALGIPSVAVGIVLAIVVAMVIIGGIKRIGHVAGILVPVMCVLYLIAGFIVILMNITSIPAIFGMIFTSAFSPQEATGAFIGGTAGYAFLWGMKRALFSSEAGQGSSPIAHSAAKTSEPVREGVVAGLEPFIDTIVVCTLTALVILSSGAWDRGGVGEAQLAQTPAFTQGTTGEGASAWNLGTQGVPPGGEQATWYVPLPGKTDGAKKTTGKDWVDGDNAFVVARTGTTSEATGTDLVRISGEVHEHEGAYYLSFEDPVESEAMPTLVSADVFKEYPGAALTAHAFDRAIPGLGTYLVLLAAWLFAISTMISWSYYGEQGVVFVLGKWAVIPYKIFYCAMIIVSTVGIITTDAELDSLTALGTGVMLWANIPIMLIFGYLAMKAYHAYGRRLKAGEFTAHEARNIEDMAKE
ncbi:MAG: amino acid carrier protein [Planctomycetota bacterium]|nr:amino acid carrier protein [Planctomycetota bacterium]MEC9158111.1 amino acid carrier protein [Planctomycetota bacterium]